MDTARDRERMVRVQIAARGIRDQAVLDAFRSVPREAFLPPELREFAYQDSPLPIEKGQTISQPYIVALMTAALGLRAGDRVLEIGTGSGYAAAILGRIARSVYTLERHEELAKLAAQRLAELGFDNVSVRCGDGSLGWPEHAPYDAIAVAAGGPGVPPALLEQLEPGGRLVMPVGEGRELQKLVRITRERDGSFASEDLGDVRFVPLIGEQGWAEREEWDGRAPRGASRPTSVARLIREQAVAIDDLESQDLGPLLARIADARLVLIGEASHGTSEFYRLRAEITKQLIASRGFQLVAIEADWPDVAVLNQWVQGRPLGSDASGWLRPFQRFPIWMWRNHETLAFVDWLREHNAKTRGDRPAACVYGLDLYSLFTSIQAVLQYLDRVDPGAARVARERYGCLTPWEADPAAYGRAAISGGYRVCEREAVAMLRDLAARRLEYAERDGEAALDAVQNARLVADAERYYRAMYYGSNESWNLRDQHMFDTLESLLAFHGAGSKAVIWAHNSHLGDAAATEMGLRGQLNLGQLCRAKFGASAFLIGFGTDRGSVAAADEWDGPMRVMQLRPSHRDSYERLCHDAAVRAFFLHLREPRRAELRYELEAPRLERAIGVVYRPDSELQSHYFHASLPHQFDEYVWIDETRAVHPVLASDAHALPRTHPLAAQT
ncbi:MAG TPA: protein-L-isoaspartate(D-aspartate) O-methyltransferase [Myxococcota bacterium]|nr:protein-L-isoaspartate(D-aspartate) O-methyltransferase [Myxococcota bacterium]